MNKIVLEVENDLPFPDLDKSKEDILKEFIEELQCIPEFDIETTAKYVRILESLFLKDLESTVAKIKYGYYTQRSVKFKDDPNQYKKDGTAMREKFKNDLISEYRLEGHPKADKLFDLAWEKGHSSGWEEVANEFDEMAGLLS